MYELLSFRNTNHEQWFYVSMVILLISVLIFVLFGSKHQFKHLFFFHIPNVFIASYVVIFEKISKVYSIDCIWFNGLMPGIYVGLYFLATYNEKKRKINI